MRVLYVSHSKEVGGAEAYLAGLILHAAHDHRVTLVCRRDAALDAWLNVIKDAGVSIHRLDFTRIQDFRRCFALARGADLAHLVLAYPVGKYQLAAAVLVRLAGRPLVITHQLTLDLGRLGISRGRRLIWSAAFRRYRRLARRHIVVSRAGRQMLIERYGFSSTDIRVIYNGADLSAFTTLDTSARAAARQRMAAGLTDESWTKDQLVVITVARLSQQKGLPDLLTAAAVVLARLPNARFVLVGGGELYDDLRARSAHGLLAGRVFIAGAREKTEVAAWLSASDLFVLPSRFEGLPLALVEAMAAGCAPVATRVGGVPEVISDESLGILVPAGDPSRLAEAIMALLEDGDRRAAIGRAAQRRAEAFDVQACYAQTMGVYRELADSTARRG